MDEIRAVDLEIAFSKKIVTEVSDKGFKGSYTELVVDWERMAKALNEREQRPDGCTLLENADVLEAIQKWLPMVATKYIGLQALSQFVNALNEKMARATLKGAPEIGKKQPEDAREALLREALQEIADCATGPMQNPVGELKRMARAALKGTR